MFSQEAETKAKTMEAQIGQLQKKLEERNEQLQASTSTTEKVPYNVCFPLLSWLLSFCAFEGLFS